MEKPPEGTLARRTRPRRKKEEKEPRRAARQRQCEPFSSIQQEILPSKPKETLVTSLVTGATGFLGARLVRALVESGENVRILGRNRAVLEALKKSYNAQPFECDLREREAVVEACRNVDTVYHLGALTAPWAPDHEYQGVNVEGTQNVLAGCEEHGVRRLVFTSTLTVLMDGKPQANLPEPVPYPKKHISELARSKRQAEERVRAAPGTLETVILRLATVYGPGDPHFLPALAVRARARKLRQIGSGRNRTELLFRDNAVHALLLAGTAPGGTGGTYAITGGEAAYVWSILRGWLGQLGVPGELPTTSLGAALLEAKLSELLAGATNAPPPLTREQVCWLGLTHTYDNAAAERDLGFVPPVSQDEGIARTMHALSIRTG
jgi:2-alkyl-3-oxoalkanoate reductase